MSAAVVSLRTLAAVGIASSLHCLIYALARAPSGEAVRLGLRGLKRRRAVDENPAWAQLEPAVRWLGQKLRGWVSQETADAWDVRITLAGDMLGLVPEELLALSALGLVTFGLGGAAAGRVVGLDQIGSLAGLAMGALAPFYALQSVIHARQEAVARRLPYAIDLMALGMGAGLDFPSAMTQVVEKAGTATHPLVEELSLVLQSLRVGLTRQQALEGFVRRVPCTAVIDFVGAVVQAELRGTPVAQVLVLQADVARRQRSATAEQAAARAAVKLVIPLGLVFLCVLLIIVAPIVISMAGGGL